MRTEFKLFKPLLDRLADGNRPISFALLNSRGQIDIESVSWAMLPTQIQQEALAAATEKIRNAELGSWTSEFDNWQIQVETIWPQSDKSRKTWAIVYAYPSDDERFTQYAWCAHTTPVAQWNP